MRPGARVGQPAARSSRRRPDGIRSMVTVTAAHPVRPALAPGAPCPRRRWMGAVRHHRCPRRAAPPDRGRPGPTGGDERGLGRAPSSAPASAGTRLPTWARHLPADGRSWRRVSSPSLDSLASEINSRSLNLGAELLLQWAGGRDHAPALLTDHVRQWSGRRPASPGGRQRALLR